MIWKILLVAAVVLLAWNAWRWIKRAGPDGEVARHERRTERARTARRRLTAHDTERCGTCSAYVAVGVGGCERADCPRR